MSDDAPVQPQPVQPQPVQPQPQPVLPAPHVVVPLTAPVIAKDHRLDKIGWIVGGAIISVVIASGGWLGGMLYERLEKAEDRIVELEKEDVKHGHLIESLQDQTRRQWELLSETKGRISEIEGKLGGNYED